MIHPYHRIIMPWNYRNEKYIYTITAPRTSVRKDFNTIISILCMLVVFSGNKLYPVNAFLGEGDQHFRSHLPGGHQIIGEDPRDHDLAQKLLFRIQPLGPFHDDLDIVVQKADDPEAHGHEQHRDDPGIIFHIKKGRDHNAGKDDQSPHGRRPLFF